MESDVDRDLVVVRLIVLRCARGRGLPTRRPARTGEQGSTVLESALAIPSLIAVAFILLWALVAGTTNVRLAAVAHDVARGLARGEAAAELIARSTAGLPDAQVRIEDRGDLVGVTVSKDMRASMPILDGLGVTLEQSAVAPREGIGP